jgi:hypothetical protein
VAGPIILHYETIARKGVRCVRMVETEEFSSTETLALRLAFPHTEISIHPHFELSLQEAPKTVVIE